MTKDSGLDAPCTRCGCPRRDHSGFDGSCRGRGWSLAGPTPGACQCPGFMEQQDKKEQADADD